MQNVSITLLKEEIKLVTLQRLLNYKSQNTSQKTIIGYLELQIQHPHYCRSYCKLTSNFNCILASNFLNVNVRKTETILGYGSQSKIGKLTKKKKKQAISANISIKLVQFANQNSQMIPNNLLQVCVGVALHSMALLIQ